MPARRDLTGQRFGRLVVQYYAPPRKWLCKCDCGKETFTRGDYLLRGYTKSCGCLRDETRSANGKKAHLRKPTKIVTRCPCCGQPAPSMGFPADLIHLPVMEQAIFNVVKSANLEGISTEAIRERLRLYHPETGEPYSRNYVQVVTKNLNKRIRSAWGLCVKSTGGRGAIYRLVKL